MLYQFNYINLSDTDQLEQTLHVNKPLQEVMVCRFGLKYVGIFCGGQDAPDSLWSK